MAVVTFQSSLLKKEKNSNDAWNFYFAKPSHFNFQAGQYIKMWMDIESPDDRGVTRYFTISASPTEDHLMVTTRILKSTFKMTLGDLKIGAKVKMRGPWGDFVFPKEITKSIVFIAGGIGMTPFRSLIKYTSDTKLNIPITLFASYKTPDQILYKEELAKLEKENSSIHIITTITEPEGTGWKGEVGRIDQQLLQKHLDSLSDKVYYIAGPDPMVEGMKKMLIQAGVKRGKILEDGFPGY